MIYIDETVLVDHDDDICAVRFKCSNTILLKLIRYFIGRSSLNDLLNNIDSGFACRYFRTFENDVELKYLYKKNNKADCPVSFNNSLVEVLPVDEFINKDSGKKLFIFEMIYQANESSADGFEDFCDPISFIYVRILHEALMKHGFEHVFAVFSNITHNSYFPIEDADFFKFKSFLCLNSKQLNNRILVLRTDTQKLSRLFTDESLGQQMELGRICPLFDISFELLSDLQKNTYGLSKDNYLAEIVFKFAGNIGLLFDKYGTLFDLNSYIENDAVLDVLLFACTAYYIIDEIEHRYVGSEIKKQLETYDFTILHERCADYAQGITQLIENAYYHAINDVPDTSGYWCLRVRTLRNTVAVKKDFDTKLEGNGKFLFCDKDNCYFIEVYITDFSLNSDRDFGIVNKFYKNIQDRLLSLPDPNAEAYRCMETILNTRDSNPIVLKQMFGIAIEKNKLDKYLHLPENVAYHYGLQILDNVVLTGGGCLYVTSGEKDYKTEKQTLYNDTVIPWENGTAYVLVLPAQLHENEQINYLDKIDRVDEGAHSGISPFVEAKFVQYFNEIVKDGYSVSPSEKNTIVDILVKQMCYDCSSNDNIYIDCTLIKNEFAMEILSKTVFLCLANDNNITNVGLINLNNYRDVIKMFRHFALFYDRYGTNSFMNSKSVFMADENAQMDLLLCGPISSINYSLHNNQIYGGVNEEVMNIISYLGKREDKKNA